MSDLISRSDAIDAMGEEPPIVYDLETEWTEHDVWVRNIRALSALPSADAVEYESTVTLNSPISISAEAVQGWIPCYERLPEDLEAVNVTWVNHNPPVYYQYTKDVPNADPAVYYRGAWYWWDATVIDLLGEYGGAYIHGIEPIDKDVEVTAWMPLPKPYKGGDTE